MRRMLLVMLLVLAVLPARGDVMDAPRGKKWIWVDVNLKQLTLYEGKTALKQYPIATGTLQDPTPLGIFYINSRFAGEMSGFGTCFLGLNVPWGQYGIHGTNKPESIGTNASHGCIRMRVADAEALYAAVPDWTMVVIEGGPYGNLDTWLRPLKSGTGAAMCGPCRKGCGRWGIPCGAPTAFTARPPVGRYVRREKNWGCPKGTRRTGLFTGPSA